MVPWLPSIVDFSITPVLVVDLGWSWLKTPVFNSKVVIVADFKEWFSFWISQIQNDPHLNICILSFSYCMFGEDFMKRFIAGWFQFVKTLSRFSFIGWT